MFHRTTYKLRTDLCQALVLLLDVMICVSVALTLVNEYVAVTGAVEHSREQMYDNTGSRVCDLCLSSVAFDRNDGVCKS